MSAHGTFFDDVGFPSLASVFFGQTATYQPVSGDAVPECDVVITKDVLIQPVGYESTVVDTADVLEALVDQVWDITEGDTFTLDEDGAVYTCKRELENNGKVAKWVVHGS